MWLGEMPPALLALVAILIAQPVTAGLIPERLLHSLEDLQSVAKRGTCAGTVCGFYGQLCCTAGEYCYTDASNQAQCGTNPGSAVQTAVAAGSWQYYTTTYVETDLKTVTATFSSLLQQTTLQTTTLSCSYSLGQTPCGSVCCLSGQYCASSGSCVAVGGGSSGYYSSLYTTTKVVTNTASAPLRPTSDVTVTQTATGTVSTTVPFITPVGTDGSIISGTSASTQAAGLSGGAIAGIVIGVILGLIILILLCLFLCARGLWNTIFGKKRRRTEVTEEVYERHSRRGGKPTTGRTWYGAAKPQRTQEKKKKSGLGGFGTAAAALAGLWVVLGLKRKNDRRHDDKSSASYYSYSDYTGTSASE